MLSLNPPFLRSGRLVIFRDDADANCFYYQNMQPHIVRDDKGNPMVFASAIYPRSGTSQTEDTILEATLTVDVDLAASELELNEAAKAISKSFGVKAKILAPAPVSKGNVRFYMATTADVTDSGKWFVTSDVRPSMIGTNRVSLVVCASGLQAEILIAAAMQGANAASICYELDLVGITPAYHAKLHARMSDIYSKLTTEGGYNFLFTKADFESVIEKSIKLGYIQYEVSEMDPDVQNSAMNSLMDDLRKQVLDLFFEPVDLVSRANDRDVGEKIADGVSDFLDALLPGSRLLRRSVDTEDIRDYMVDLSQRRVKTTPVAPQSILKTMLEMDGVDMGKQIEHVYLDQIPIIRQKVDIKVPVDMFDDTNIKSLLVNYRIRDLDTGQIESLPKDSFEFMKDQTDYSFEFNRNKEHRYMYEYQARMYVADTSSVLIGAEESITGDDWKQSQTSYVYIDPTISYRNLKLDFELEDITVFDHLKMIQATVQVVPKGGGESLYTKTYPLTASEAQNAHRQINLLVKKDAALEFRLHLEYDIPGEIGMGKDYTLEDGSFFLIPNPFKTHWKVDLLCFADWSKYCIVYLDTRYKNPMGEGEEYQHFEFREGETQSVIKVPIAPDVPQRTFEYRIQWIDSEGEMFSAGWYVHKDLPSRTIIVKNLKPEKVFRFLIDDPEFFRKSKFSLFRVTVRYSENGQDIDLPSAVFDMPEQVLEFTPPERAACSYQLVVLKQNGSSPISPKWRPLQDDNEKIYLNVSSLIAENL